ncbi:hypothetical protein NLU13_8154 [Sarocladium strictum]|uniref:DUF7492 domain-containing protein n=1 Tax=Sarocladium strictum TaxID=5046 RepID=A0AA39L4W1_SARSR|nr:hypothetical protein NLU13_8154 [Sarocladium strictum]
MASSLNTFALLALILPFTNAHSWVERASRIAPNGTMTGPIGFARGYVPRDSTNPPFTDTIPTNILPVAGQSMYSGDEIINKFPLDPNPAFPLLQAAPGDHIAIMHLENGHTTLPQNQPNKPRNRGTIFFYGTSDPKPQERLFDVHLVWNAAGTGGDKRGRLLGTRNYDDGQCYQPNNAELSTSRAAALAPEGAKHDIELACQSDLQLPKDLKPGSIYTIYWYWDWPDLNPPEIDMDKTKDGLYPWAGTFMRGQKDPNGFKPSAIAKNESYSSVIDIKISAPNTNEEGAKNFQSKAEGGNTFIQDQDIYTKAIQSQMQNNYQVDVPGLVKTPEPPQDDDKPSGTTTRPPPTGATVTVTELVTVPAATVVKTVTITAGAEPTSTSVQLPGGVFISSFLPGVPKESSTSVSSSSTTSRVLPPAPEETESATQTQPTGGRPIVTPFLRARADWGLGWW